MTASNGHQKKPEVLLFGAGSIGTVYLYLLSKVANVTAVCRSNYGVVKENGFIINSAIWGDGIEFKPNVVRDCTEAASSSTVPFDYLVVCSKAMPNTIPDIIKPAVTPGHTAIVLIQNGVGIENEYVDAFPTNPIISTVVYMPATQRPAGIITHGDIELLEIGDYPASSTSSHAADFTQLVKAAGGTANLYDDIQYLRWKKLLLNASWNPICALSRSTDVDFMRSSPLATNFVLETMLEVVDVAAAYGHKFSREDVETQLKRATVRIKSGKGIEPSMLQDVKEGRRMEVEAIAGNVLRLAKDKAVPCAKLEALYILANALDTSIKNQQP